MLELGLLKLPNPVILAPMAGVTDPPFRQIVRSYHRGLLCGEMISSMALHYNSEKTRDYFKVDPAEKPVSMQIFGANPALMAAAAREVEANGADIIDINMGCPVPKVVKNGEGAALLNNLPLAGRIIKAVVDNVKIPVTVKLRLGWDQDHIVAPELAKIAADCGVAGVTVHGRTREQFYQGKADWDGIAEVKRSVSIPVIGNGDVNSPAAAKALIKQTGCDGVMIGQAALGNPWLFHQVVTYLERGILEDEPSLNEKFAVIWRHLELQVAYSGPERGLKEMRKHFAWYIKGMPGSAKMRELLNTLTTLAEVCATLDKYASSLGGQLKTAE